VVKTLLVDGDNLFKIGFHGVRDFYHEGKHIGGIYHFINVIQRFLSEYNYDKIIVFWDGSNNSSQRKKIYPLYKENRRLTMNEEKKESYYYQKTRVRQYLEEMFVRQICIDDHECDDLVAHYCNVSDEKITILSSDKDLTQLITPKVHIYSPIAKEWITDKHKVKIGNIQVPVQNVKLVKILLGDKSDNIEGIYSFGEKKLVKYFPEVVDNVINIGHILDKSKEILANDDKQKPIQNLLSGKTKSGTEGMEYFSLREKIVSLLNPIITEDAKNEVELYYSENLDPEGRGYKNLIRMMIEDGMFKYLPQRDDNWVEFIQPILKLTRKEKKRFKNN
jgi:5'-3' exonuclease